MEILSIGNELLLGNTVNTNASWIAARVTKLGGKVTRITTVGDDLGEISQALLESLGRKINFLITTGGIGPTFDDMTLKAVAKALHLRIGLNRVALEMIREHYARRFPGQRVELTKPRLKMAMMPSTATPVRNPAGTAPAVRVNVGGIVVFCLPGVPSEAKAIFRDTVSQFIAAKAGGMTFQEEWIRVQGVMESSLAPIIDSVMNHWRGVYIKSHPRGIETGGRPKIELHFSASSAVPREARNLIASAVEAMEKQLQNHGARVTVMT